MFCVGLLGSVALAASLPSFNPLKLVSAGDVPYPVASVADGVVVLQVAPDRTGRVTGTTTLRDIPSLTDPAVASVKSWTFRAASREDRPTAPAMTVAVVFRPAVVQAAPPAFDAVRPGIESGYVPASIRVAAYPEYPVNSVASGTVVLQVALDEAGRVGTVETIHGIPSLTAYTKRAIKDWRFDAATLNGKPVASNVAIAFVFRPLFAVP